MNAETGNSLWRLLHAFADQYPDTPSKEAQDGAMKFLSVFGQVVKDRSYGCWCHNEWKKVFACHPPPVDNGKAFREWCIVVHDKVNAKLGRQLFAPELSLSHPIFTS